MTFYRPQGPKTPAPILTGPPPPIPFVYGAGRLVLLPNVHATGGMISPLQMQSYCREDALILQNFEIRTQAFDGQFAEFRYVCMSGHLTAWNLS